MSVTRLRLPLFAMSAIVPSLIVACGSSDSPQPTTVAADGPNSQMVSPADSGSGGSAGATAGEIAPAAVNYDDAELAFRAGQYKEAADRFTAYTERRPENPWGHYMLGLATWKAGDLGRAEAAFDAALALDPRHVKSLLNSGRVLLERGRPAEAIERIETALEIDTSSSEGLRLLGRAQYTLGEVDAAVDAYRQALSVNDRDPWAMNNLALIYIEQGRAADALPPLARAVQLRKTAPVFQNNLGIALERTGHYSEAATAFEAALAADSTYGKASVSLARVKEHTASPIGEGVDLAGLADEFKLQMQMWRDSVQHPVAEAVEDSVGADSVGTDSTMGDTPKSDQVE